MIKPAEAYDQYVYSEKFYKIIKENLKDRKLEEGSRKVRVYSVDLVSRIRTSEKSGVNSIYLSNSKLPDSKKLIEIIFEFEDSSKVMGIKIRKSNISYYIFHIWLMEDNYVFVAYVGDRSELDNYRCKVYELSEFMKVLKNPLDLL
jgi:hypothetical protein